MRFSWNIAINFPDNTSSLQIIEPQRLSEYARETKIERCMVLLIFFCYVLLSWMFVVCQSVLLSEQFISTKFYPRVMWMWELGKEWSVKEDIWQIVRALCGNWRDPLMMAIWMTFIAWESYSSDLTYKLFQFMDIFIHFSRSAFHLEFNGIQFILFCFFMFRIINARQ